MSSPDTDTPTPTTPPRTRTRTRTRKIVKAPKASKSRGRLKVSKRASAPPRKTIKYPAPDPETGLRYIRPRRSINPLATRACLCGCGTKVPRYFHRGHIMRFQRKLETIRRGADPYKVFVAEIADALGPWVAIDDGIDKGGKTPTKSFTEARGSVA